METLKKYLFELCSESAPSGREDLLISVERMIKPYSDECYRDSAGNLISVKYSKIPGSKKILLDAHADEIGLIVTDIDENGFLHFANHAGIDEKILPASTVTVLGARSLTGIVATLPPHLIKDADTKKKIKAKDMVIDIGYDAKRAKELVKIGDLITLRAGMAELKNDRIMGKSLDNRACCSVLAKLISILCKVSPCYDVYTVFSAAEEFGGYGAKTAALNIKPDSAIVLDTTFAVSPYTGADKASKLDCGAVICFSPLLDNHMSESLIGIARSRSIPYQKEATGGRTGTNADSITVSASGIPCALVSIPIRYMHSAGEIVSLADMYSAERIVLSYLEYRGGISFE